MTAEFTFSTVNIYVLNKTGFRKRDTRERKTDRDRERDGQGRRKRDRDRQTVKLLLSVPYIILIYERDMQSERK